MTQPTQWTDERIISEITADPRPFAAVVAMLNDMAQEIAALKQELAAAKAGEEQLRDMYKEELLEQDPMKYDALYGDNGEGVGE